MKKVVIFDFDGTLADSASVVRSIYADLAKDKGWPKLTDAAYKQLRRGTIQQAIKWVGIRPWQMPGLLREGRNLFKKHSSEIKLFSGIDEVVKNLASEGWELYVLSSNVETTVHQVLKDNGISRNMQILRRPPLFGKHKSINKLVEQKAYDQAHVWMIGDELRDIEAANKSGVNSIAVSWGLQDESLLKKAKPTFLAKYPRDIEKYLRAS